MGGKQSEVWVRMHCVPMSRNGEMAMLKQWDKQWHNIHWSKVKVF